MDGIAQNILAALEDRTQRARQYFDLRAENPREPVRRIWAYIMAAQDEYVGTYRQFYCQHQWSSGYDDCDHEINIRCMLCGADGDA